MVVNLWSDTNTMKKSTDSILQGIIYQYIDTIKEAFFLLEGKTSELYNHKKRTFEVYIMRLWGKIIVG